MKKAITTLALAGLMAGAATAEARTVAYSGKDSSGERITFKKSGNRIKRIRTAVTTVCLPSDTGYSSRTGVDLFQPPGAFKLGKTTKRKQLQKTAMWYSKVTKNYKVSARNAGGGKIKGKLHMSFSYAMPVFDYYGPHLVIYICSGDAKFTAHAR